MKQSGMLLIASLFLVAMIILSGCRGDDIDTNDTTSDDGDDVADGDSSGDSDVDDSDDVSSEELLIPTLEELGTGFSNMKSASLQPHRQDKFNLPDGALFYDVGSYKFDSTGGDWNANYEIEVVKLESKDRAKEYYPEFVDKWYFDGYVTTTDSSLGEEGIEKVYASSGAECVGDLCSSDITMHSVFFREDVYVARVVVGYVKLVETATDEMVIEMLATTRMVAEKTEAELISL